VRKMSEKKKCPQCKYPKMNHKRYSYHGVKNAIFIDTDKLITIDEYNCPRCGYFTKDESVS